MTKLKTKRVHDWLRFEKPFILYRPHEVQKFLTQANITQNSSKNQLNPTCKGQIGTIW